MGMASMIIGIVSVMVSLVPCLCLGLPALLPAVLGLILGISDIITKRGTQESTGTAISGIILNTLSLLMITFWIMLIVMIRAIFR